MQQPSTIQEPHSGVHYDLPARIFELLLDRNMNYSCGYFVGTHQDLDLAQTDKLDHIADFLGLRPGSRLLDAGCGWGGPALYFAEHYGCHVTGVTLSSVQQKYIKQWASQRTLTGSINVEIADINKVSLPPAHFDGIMFLESIIHMPNKASIFNHCAALLKDNGRTLIQESHYDKESRRDQYVQDRGFREVDKAFGYTSHLMSGGAMIETLEEAGLAPLRLENISDHYIKTLTIWLNNLDSNASEMRAVSEQAYSMLRRYLMVALATYRMGSTVCHIISAEKSPRTYTRPSTHD